MPNYSPTSYSDLNRVPRKGAIALVTTVLAVLLLFGFKTGEQATLAGVRPTSGVVGDPASPTARPVAGGTGPTQPPTGATTPPQPVPPTNTGGRASGTFTGDAIDTPYGTVQIALVVQDGQIVDIKELQMPFDRRLSQQISAEAGPLLRQQVLRAQSADINGVSGASFTSYGYWQSLQSALAQVH
jgi:uncharacterized protein with FMN-binding domain